MKAMKRPGRAAAMSKRPADVDVGPPRPTDDDDDVGPPRPSDDDDVGPPRPSDDDGEDVGPARPPVQKKRKAALEFAELYLENLPVGEMYEKSYMHRDVVTDVIVTPNEFVITASCDGQVRAAAARARGLAAQTARSLASGARPAASQRHH